MAADQTDPTRVSVYILEEVSTDPDIPAQTAYRKIGVAARSYHEDPFYHRTRLFHQGNVRQLKVAHSFEVKHETDARVIATGIEKKVHSILKRSGIKSLKDDTHTTGHSEWFKVSLDQAKDALIEAIQYQAEMISYRLDYRYQVGWRHLDYGYYSCSGEFFDTVFETKKKILLKQVSQEVNFYKFKNPDDKAFSSEVLEQQFRDNWFNQEWEKFLVKADLFVKLPIKESETT